MFSIRMTHFHWLQVQLFFLFFFCELNKFFFQLDAKQAASSLMDFIEKLWWRTRNGANRRSERDQRISGATNSERTQCRKERWTSVAECQPGRPRWRRLEGWKAEGPGGERGATPLQESTRRCAHQRWNLIDQLFKIFSRLSFLLHQRRFFVRLKRGDLAFINFKQKK